MSEKVDLTEVPLDDLIEEIEDRGHTVDRESDIEDFSDDELLDYLGIEDDSDVDWNRLYQLFHANNEADAILEIKKIIQSKTGRILV